MLCPKCGVGLSPWPWQDGGYKGVLCDSCGTRWWSDDFADKAREAVTAAVALVVATSKFPADAVTDEEMQKRWRETLDG